MYLSTGLTMMLSRQGLGIARRQFSSITRLYQEIPDKVLGNKTQNEQQPKVQKDSGILYLGKSLEDLSTPEVEKAHIAKQFQTDFEPGTTYDPFDFSIAKIHLERKLNRNKHETPGLDKRKLNPLNYYTNPRFLSNFVSSTGKILHRDVTKLSHKNQKRVSVAIKRARAAGLLSSVHKDVVLIPHRHGV